MMGGLPLPSLTNEISGGDGIVRGAAVPGMGPVITIRTDQEAMMADGIMPEFGGRPVRRSPFRMGGGMGMGPMMPSVPRYTPMDGGNGMPPSGGHNNVQVNITKLE